MLRCPGEFWTIIPSFNLQIMKIFLLLGLAPAVFALRETVLETEAASNNVQLEPWKRAVGLKCSYDVNIHHAKQKDRAQSNPSLRGRRTMSPTVASA